MDDLEPQLASEGAGRPRVVLSAIVAGVLLLAGAVYGTIVLSGLPTVGLVQGLAPALHGQATVAVDPHSSRLAFTDHHGASLIIAAVLISLGTIGMIPVLRHLYEATRFRQQPGLEVPTATPGGPRPLGGRRLPRAALILAVVGAGVGGICLLAVQVIDVIKAHDFIGHADRSHHAVGQAANSLPHVVLSSLAIASQLALAFALVMIPLNAMRVGLLTRFMGFLGVASGPLMIILPPVIPAFWLVGLGLLLSGRAPTPLPPAWQSGEAEPWPTQEQQRGRRDPKRLAEPAVAMPASVPVPRAPRELAPNASKKRKKRR